MKSTQSQNEPALPEPDHYHMRMTIGADPSSGAVPSYSADKLRAYGQQWAAMARAQALEEAAKVADGFVDPEWPNDDMSQQAESIAAAVRALKDKPDPA